MIELSLIIAVLILVIVWVARGWGKAEQKVDEYDQNKKDADEKNRIHHRVRTDDDYRDRVRDEFRR